jgi:lipopolysaccharide heptosyltransferase I
VLLVRLSALGDILQALPTLAALKALHPGVTVDWAVDDRSAGLLEGRRDLGRLLVLPRRELRKPLRRPRAFLRAARRFVGALRSVAYDAVLDLQGNLKSGLVTRFARAGIRFGLDRRLAREGNHLFTSRRARPRPAARHRVERGLALLAEFLGREVPRLVPELPGRPEVAADVDRALAAAGLPGRGFAILHPGTSRFGEFKRWPAERFGDLARRLAGRGFAVAVTGGPGEEELTRRVFEASRGRAIVLPASTLPFLVEVLRRAAFFVSADTGPLHLAGFLGVPVLGLFGPKDPEVYGPWGPTPGGGAGPLPVLVRPDVACRPCGLRRCADPVCMSGITPDAVLRGLHV